MSPSTPHPAVLTLPGAENASQPDAYMQERASKYVSGYRWRRHGFDMEVVERSGDVVLVRKTTPSGWVGWEVASLTRHQGYTLAGKTFPPGESYPLSEQWGLKGWSYTTETEARGRMARVARKAK